MSKICKICELSFEPPKKCGGPSVCCSDACRKKLAAKRAKRHSQKLLAAGKCLDCGQNTTGRKHCVSCMRKRVIKEHRKKGRGRFYLGSKNASERSDWILHKIKFLNPLLAQNWPACEGWLREHYELWIEPSEQGTFVYYSLDLTQKSYPREIQKALYELDLSCPNSLEELVIAKIDYEKELKCKKLTAARDAAEATKAQLGA